MTTARFDKAATDWDNKPRRVQLAQAIATAITTSLPLSHTMTALEYGCGTGLVALDVAPNVGKLYALDSSSGMIDVLQNKIAQGTLGDRIIAIHGDLADIAQPSFELIFMSMVLHHIPAYQDLLATLVKRLSPGGYLAIADLETEDGSFHDDNNDIAHFGFQTAALARYLEELGLSNSRQQTAFSVEKNNRHYPVFLLTAQKSRL